MDTTLAVSEAGVNVAFQKGLQLIPPLMKGSTASLLNIFFATYAVSVKHAGGVATLENAPANKLDVSGLNISGNVFLEVTFDLGQILPHICIPPFQICGDIPFLGHTCTPQYCIDWRLVDFRKNLPFSFNVDLTAGFGVYDLGSQWGIVLLVDPFAQRFDFSPMAPVIMDGMKQEVHDQLSSYPLVGDVIAELLGKVMDAFTPLVSLLLEGFSGVLDAILESMDPLTSMPFTLFKFDKLQTFIPANVPLSGDAPVKLTLSALSANVLDKELVAEGQLA